jgi:ubiquinone/menaquinone biosynthesis C-methylase UbiE
MTADREIAAYYERGKEQRRLTEWGRLERLRTLELLERYLPPAPATVLDVGGGAGAYAVELARDGYAVHLIDPVALHVEQALAAATHAPLASARTGDARDLLFDDAGAEAVLLLGPLYHLTEPSDRARALHEAKRVLRPGGVLLAAAISRFASTMHGILKGFLLEPGFEEVVARDVVSTATPTTIRTGSRPPTSTARTSSSARWRAPASTSTRCWRSRARPARTPRSGSSMHGSTTPPSARSSMRAITRVEGERSLLGASPHVMAIATRP